VFSFLKALTGLTLDMQCVFCGVRTEFQIDTNTAFFHILYFILKTPFWKLFLLLLSGKTKVGVCLSLITRLRRKAI
jgi:hypothetical protein